MPKRIKENRKLTDAHYCQRRGLDKFLVAYTNQEVVRLRCRVLEAFVYFNCGRDFSLRKIAIHGTKGRIFEIMLLKTDFFIKGSERMNGTENRQKSFNYGYLLNF